jgi:hypothetical protein
MFFVEKPASASVVAVEPVELYVIDGFGLFCLHLIECFNCRWTLKKLLKLKPALGGRFFKYLATVVQERLVKRESLLYTSPDC